MIRRLWLSVADLALCRLACALPLLQAHPEAEPCHLLMSAAQLALERKSRADQLIQMSSGPTAFDTSSVKRGRYLGQYERKQPEGPTNSW